MVNMMRTMQLRLHTMFHGGGGTGNLGRQAAICADICSRDFQPSYHNNTFDH